MPHVPPLLQAAVTSEVTAHSVERTGARRARAGRDDSQRAGAEATGRGRHVTTGLAHVVRREVSRPAGPARESPEKLRDLLLPGSERQDNKWWGRGVAKARGQQG